MGDNIVIIDLMNLFTRHYCANPAMNNKGEQIGGIVGVLYAIKNLCDTLFPTAIYICWEGSGGATKKRKLFPEYKSNRKVPKLNRFYEDDIPDGKENKLFQISSLVEIFKHLPVYQIYIADTEGDDIIGYISRYKFKDDTKIIVSNDKDFYQLLGENIKIFSPNKKIFITKQDAINELGISPINFCLAKTINGDSSDNVDGIKGAGFKTIVKCFPELTNEEEKNIKDIIAICEEKIKDKKCLSLYKNILLEKDKLYRNWKLMNLDTNNLNAHQIKKIDHIIDDFKPKTDKLNFIKKIFEKGVSNFNIEAFFFSLNCVKRAKKGED